MSRRLALLSALVVGALVAPPAHALPGDPPIEQLAPADGAAVALTPAGILVTYTCGLYRKSDFGSPFIDYGDCSDTYGADLSASPELGTDGRLRSDRRVVGGTVTDNTTPEGQQRALLITHPNGGARVRPGTYYWQAYRFIAGGFDTSPVRSFTVKSVLANLRLSVPGRAYAGYPLTLGVRVSGDPDAPPVTVERRAGGRWVALTPQNLRPPRIQDGRAAPVVTLPAGSQRLRAVVTEGRQRTVSPEVTVPVRVARSWTTTRSAGRYAGGPKGQSVKARVAPGGRGLRGFEAEVTLSCVRASTTPGQAIETTFLPGLAPVAQVRVAPDGRFTAVRRYDKTTVELAGRVVGRRITGRVDLEVGECSGGYAFSLRRR